MHTPPYRFTAQRAEQRRALLIFPLWLLKLLFLQKARGAQSLLHPKGPQVESEPGWDQKRKPKDPEVSPGGPKARCTLVWYGLSALHPICLGLVVRFQKSSDFSPKPSHSTISERFQTLRLSITAQLKKFLICRYCLLPHKGPEAPAPAQATLSSIGHPGKPRPHKKVGPEGSMTESRECW